MWSRAGSRSTGRRLDPRRQQQGAGPVPGRACVSGRLEGGQDPLRASAVAEDDPGPAEPVDDVERQRRVVDRAPGQCGVDVGALGPRERQVLGLAAAAHALGGRRGGLREPGGMRCEGAFGQPGVVHRLEREGADAVEQPVADERAAPAVAGSDSLRRRRRRSPASGSQPADDVDRRGCGHVEGFEDGLHRRQRRAAREGGQGPQPPLVIGEQQLVAPPDGRLE